MVRVSRCRDRRTGPSWHGGCSRGPSCCPGEPGGGCAGEQIQSCTVWGDGIPVTLGKGRRFQGGWEGSVVRGGGSRGVRAGSAGCRLDDGHAGTTTQATHTFSGKLPARKRSLPSQDLLAFLLELASGVACWGPSGPGQGRGDSGPSPSSQAPEGSSMTGSLSRSEAPSQDVLRSQGWGGALEKGRLSQGPRPQRKAGWAPQGAWRSHHGARPPGAH